MRLLYIANIRLPTGRAHGIQIMKTCESLAREGAEVTLLVPNRRNNIFKDSFDYYGCERNFRIEYVPVIDFISIPKVGFFLTTLIFSVSVFIKSFYLKFDAIYCRDIWPLYFLSFRNVKKIYEAHDALPLYKARFLTRHLSGIVVISRGLKDFYEKISSHLPVVIAADGVSVKDFNLQNISGDDCKRELGLPLDKKIIMYTGHLYEWKGVDILAKTTLHLPQDSLLVFVGGEKKMQKEFKEKYSDKRILVIEPQTHSRIPHFLKAADVVVLPNTSKEAISRLYTSPMKLFEYMSSGTPIVASRLPSIEEVLNERNSTLVSPDSCEALAKGIMSVFDDTKKASENALQAFKDVQKYDWKERSKLILDFIRSL